MVLVYKSTVYHHDEADRIVISLQRAILGSKVNFDLEDCDNILRIESPFAVDDHIVQNILKEFGHRAELLDDFLPGGKHIDNVNN